MCIIEITKKIPNRNQHFLLDKHMNYLKILCKNKKIPVNLLLGIYLIETKYRPLYYRIGEYSIALLGCLLNITIKKPVKNYTIGYCQVGLSSILNYYGRKTYRHVRYIENLTFSDLINIIKSIYYKNNFKICLDVTYSIYEKTIKIGDDYNIQIRQIGKQFNGKYSYGFMLELVVCWLDNYYKRTGSCYLT